MSDTMQHDGDTKLEEPEVLTGRKLANAMNLLLSDLADAIDARFPHQGKAAPGVEDSPEYVANHAAHGAAYKLIEALLLVQPKDHDHRMEMYGYATKAWEMYGGRVDQDEVIGKCIDRAATDYKPVIPAQLKRGRSGEDEAADAKASGKPAAKKPGDPK